MIQQSDHPVFACFLDIREAFDSVWVEHMLTRLPEYGVDPSSWRLLQSWYANYNARVRLPHHMQTPRFRVSTGTRQGSVLSPVLFAIVINELGRRLANSGRGVWVRGADRLLASLLYGDDVVLLASSPEQLQD
ncbi:MAG: reverse transcriptase domain-containing protein, partial [bacterium]